MTNSRAKGKRIERSVAHAIKHLFPEITRNANEQSQSGGVDLKNTQPFAIEVKGGKMAHIIKVRNWLDQAQSQITREYPYPVVIARPDRHSMYAVMDFDVFTMLIESFIRYQGTTDTENVP